MVCGIKELYPGEASPALVQGGSSGYTLLIQPSKASIKKDRKHPPLKTVDRPLMGSYGPGIMTA